MINDHINSEVRSVTLLSPMFQYVVYFHNYVRPIHICSART